MLNLRTGATHLKLSEESAIFRSDAKCYWVFIVGSVKNVLLSPQTFFRRAQPSPEETDVAGSKMQPEI